MPGIAERKEGPAGFWQPFVSWMSCPLNMPVFTTEVAPLRITIGKLDERVRAYDDAVSVLLPMLASASWEIAQRGSSKGTEFEWLLDPPGQGPLLWSPEDLASVWMSPEWLHCYALPQISEENYRPEKVQPPTPPPGSSSIRVISHRRLSSI